jgi:hypothetical protein
MPTPEVIRNLQSLRQQLENARTFPHYTVLKSHVDTVLAAPEHKPHYATLRERLAESTLEAEVKHPELAASIQGVMASLTAAGL